MSRTSGGSEFSVLASERPIGIDCGISQPFSLLVWEFFCPAYVVHVSICSGYQRNWNWYWRFDWLILATNHVSLSGPSDQTWYPWGFACRSIRNWRHMPQSIPGSWQRSWSYHGHLLCFSSNKIHLCSPSTQSESAGLIGLCQYYCPTITQHRAATFCVGIIYIRTCLSSSHYTWTSQ